MTLFDNKHPYALDSARTHIYIRGKDNDMLRHCLYILAAIAAVVILTGCTTTRQSSSLVSSQRVETMMDRMDSLINTRTVISQDSVWRESVMRQFKTIREKSDTSRSVVVDTAGRIIRETTVIRVEKESDSRTDRQEREMMLQRLIVMDSTVNAMRLQMSHTDSLLLASRETVEREVEKPLSWWQQTRLWIGNLALMAVIVIVVLSLIRKKLPWKRG